jgi:putative tricarboxylic transport membrane protein
VSPKPGDVTPPYALTFSFFSIVLLIVIGLIGYFMQENGFPLTPAILAAVLLPLLELNLRRALLLADGDWTTFVDRPLPLGLLILVALGVLAPVLLKLGRRTRV